MEKVCNALSTVILVALLILTLPLVVPMLFGLTELAVLSGSMEPSIPVGSIVYVDKSVQGQDLEEGDVVTYSLQSGTFVTHRVLSLDDAAGVMVTQGDANEAPDGEISYTKLVGKVKFHLPFLGYISTNIRTSKGILAITGLVAVIILLNFLPNLVGPEEKEEDKEEKKNTGTKKPAAKQTAGKKTAARKKSGGYQPKYLKK